MSPETKVFITFCTIVLWQALILSVEHMGTTALAVGSGWARNIWQWRSRAMNKAARQTWWKEVRSGFAVTITIWLMLFVYCCFRAAYNEFHVADVRRIELAATLQDLQSFSRQKQQLENDVRSERGEAEYWHSAYGNLSHGDIHPDRFLNDEQTNKLFTALDRVSKDSRNKNYVEGVEVGCDCGGEPCQLGEQILKVFQEAHWQAKGVPMDAIKTETSQSFLPIGVVLFSDDVNKATGIAFMLRDAGIPLGPDGIFRLPQGKTRTIIWVGAKQRW